MMKRSLIAALTLVALVVAVLLLPLIRPVQAQSAGCQAVSSLSGDYSAGESRSLGSKDFSTGDKIDLSVTIDGPSDLRLLIDGSGENYDNTSGNAQSFTIPSAGSYNVTVENTLTVTISGVSISCTSGGVEPPIDSVAQTSTQGFLQTQDAVSTIVAQTQVAGATQTASSLVTQTEIARQTATAAASATNAALVPSLTFTPSATRTPTPSPWPGFSDGRLNPQIDEPYSLRCENNLLSIYRSVNGQGELLMTYPISGLGNLALRSNTTLSSPSGTLTLTRGDNPTIFYISGSIGTNAPAFASKQFELDQCISANGGLRVPTQTPTRVPSLTPTSTAQPASIVNVLFGQTPVPSANDTDGDGVRNSVDACPTVYAPKPLQFGCPDSDRDGLSDPLDLCPREPGPGGLKGGCPDYDGDGFVGKDDYCPTYAPPAERGIALGCADDDGDGYPNARSLNGDLLDWCPQRGREPNVTHLMGCPDPDNDGLVVGFGVPDAWKDPCPLSPLPPQGSANTCQSQNQTQFTPVVVDASLLLFQFASSMGSFENNTLPAMTSTSGPCNMFQIYAGACTSNQANK